MILGAAADIEVVGEAASGEEALAILAETDADIVLMDVQMPGMDGIEATREITGNGAAAYSGAAKVIILTTFDRDDYLFDSLAAGASGFLLKNADPNDLIAAVRAVRAGNALLAPEVTLRVIGRLADDTNARELESEPAHGQSANPTSAQTLQALTLREREVLVLMGQGLNNAEIAANLYLGSSTVKTHVSNVLAKTDSRDRVQAVVLAHRAGILPDDPDV